MSDRKKILWLVSWYPNKYDRFDGDFIQRHARAAALFDDIHVIFVKQHISQSKIEKIVSKEEGLTEEIIYLPKSDSVVGKWQNYHKWKKAFRTAVAIQIKQQKPSILHVHVPWKAGLIALWAKSKFNIPYIVTEHWGIYNRVVEDNIHTKSSVVRYLLKRIFKEAAAFATVSKYVGDGVAQTLVKKEYSIVPNVVDTSFFHPSMEKHPRFTFLHVSNMVPLKNIEGILAAFYQFLQTGADAQLILIGNRNNHYERLAPEIGLPNSAFLFKGEVPYTEVAKDMRRSHVFILNSNIENSPCVIGEALCSGLPVIATDVGGVSELVDDSNAILIEPNNSIALAKAMRKAFDNYGRYHLKQIAEEASSKFSFPTVANRFHTLYFSAMETWST